MPLYTCNNKDYILKTVIFIFIFNTYIWNSDISEKVYQLLYITLVYTLEFEILWFKNAYLDLWCNCFNYILNP